MPQGQKTTHLDRPIDLALRTDAPADRLADFVSILQKRHVATGCPAELRFNAIGYSAGTEVILKAADRGIVFQRVYFGGSTIGVWSGWLRDALRENRIRFLVNYHSPLDLLVCWLLGSGQFGYAGESRVENRSHAHTHLDPLFDHEDILRTIADEFDRAKSGPEHTCFEQPEYRDWYREAKRKLRREW